MKYSCYYIIHLGCFTGFTMHFYITFATNLLTQSPASFCFSLVSVFRRKGISNGVQTEWNLRESYFWNGSNPGELECTSGNQRGRNEAGGRAHWGSPGLGGTRTAGIYTLARLLYYEDKRLKTSSRIRMGLSLAWKASLAIRICRSPSL